MEQYHRLTKAVNDLSEKEAKTIIKLLLMQVADGDEKQLFQSLTELRSDLLAEQKEEALPETDTVHIVFGDSPGGSLKLALRNANRGDKLIVLPDILSVGPVKNLDTAEGLESRYEWFRGNFKNEFDSFSEMKQRMAEATDQIRQIPETKQIIIWTCENAAEQTGLRFVLYLLNGQLNEMVEINTFKAFHTLQVDSISIENFPRSSGELNSKKLLAIYEKADLKPMDDEKRKKLMGEATGIFGSGSLLRVWEQDQVADADANRYDRFIIECAKNLIAERGSNEFMVAARLIGEVIGTMEQYTGDEWIEYRIRELIAGGVFTYKGTLTGMTGYKIKLSEAFL